MSATTRTALANRRLKRAATVLCLLPAVWMVVRWIWGDRIGVPIGPRAVHREMHLAGMWTLRLLLVTLAITPLRAITGWNRITVTRRIFGVATALYGGLHLVLYVVDRNFDLARVGSELIHRRYLTVGAIALLGLAVLGITSTDGWLRRLGRRWVSLHRAVFVIAVLASLHFFMQKKFDVSEPVFYAGLLAWLLIWRLWPRRKAGEVRILALTGLAGVLAAGAIEYLWYAIATHADAWRIVATEFNPALAPRPGAQVALAALAVVVFGALVRLRRSR
jgi:methionine sulfoxide reductase heme-binding subunit